MSFKRYDYGSASNGTLAKGCEYCIRGSKMVLLVTGRCDTGCFYCPISDEKKGRDVIYANEGRVHSPEEIVAEAESMDAEGTGITGGDPLIELDRTIEVIRLLKARFGPAHHIHLYTSKMDFEKVSALRDAGLDEIRFHPSASRWSSMESTDLRRIVSDLDIDVGIEVPALPGFEKELGDMIEYAVSSGVDFINLNELEFSEGNWDMMESQGYQIKDELSSSVSGSEEVALALMKRYRDAPIHFCSSAFKDGVQLRRRLIRRANHVAERYDVITEDGTLLKGLVYTDDVPDTVLMLRDRFKVPDELMSADAERKRIEIAPWILKRIAGKIPQKCYIVEEYPTADRLEVERMPLN